ncbi:hypothetical protein E2C01_102840 [Portunus trituberculatus]|uniref:Uncharacterized protein n=1 Tax=Portunus trituberculatus TaxID=210409 RepID=A0A5B7KNQ0_PORTR|nr:hypothetical protein [Portunus trituberculatus]
MESSRDKQRSHEEYFSRLQALQGLEPRTPNPGGPSHSARLQTASHLHGITLQPMRAAYASTLSVITLV